MNNFNNDNQIRNSQDALTEQQARELYTMILTDNDDGDNFVINTSQS